MMVAFKAFKLFLYLFLFKLHFTVCKYNFTMIGNNTEMGNKCKVYIVGGC